MGGEAKKTLPNKDFIAGETISTLKKACKINKKLDMERTNSVSPLLRLWDRLPDARW